MQFRNIIDNLLYKLKNQQAAIKNFAKGTIRIFLGKYNTYDDVEKIVNGLKVVVGGDKLG